MKAVIFSFFPAFRPPTSGGEDRLLYEYLELSKYFEVILLTSGDPGIGYLKIRHSEKMLEIRIAKSEDFHNSWSQLEVDGGDGDLSGPALALSGSFVSEMHHLALKEIKDANVVIHDFPFTLPFDVLAGLDGIPRVYNSHNCEYLLYKRLHEKSGSSKIADLVKNLESNLINVSDLVLCCSEADRSAFNQIYGLKEEKSKYIPNGMNLYAVKFGTIKKRNNIVFIGSGHLPNVDAAQYIVTKLAPKFPEIIFEIIGNCLPSGDYPPNIIRHGLVSVEKKISIMGRSILALNPISSGSGSNMKILEYIGQNIPVVSTAIGARGFDFIPNCHYFEATLENFSEIIAKLINDQHVRHVVAKSALDFASERYSWKTIVISLSQYLKDVIDNINTVPFLLCLNDYNPFEGTGGGQVRLQGLYEAYTSSWKVISISFSNQKKIIKGEWKNLVRYIALPKTDQHCKEEESFSKMHHVSVNDIVSIAHLLNNRIMFDVYDALRYRAKLIIIDHPYLVALPRHFNDRFIYSSHNVEVEIKKNLLENHPLKKELISLVDWAEEYAVRASAVVFAVSEEDALLQSKNKSSTAPIIIIPNGASMPADLKQYKNYEIDNQKWDFSIVFIGSGHIPNVDAAHWILNELADKLPKFNFHIVGSVCNSIDIGTKQNIKLWGVVDEFLKSSILLNAKLAINPMFGGGGSNIKVADYLVHGLHVLSTEFGARGYNSIGNEDLTICDFDPNLFVDKINFIFNSLLIDEISVNARRVRCQRNMSMVGHGLVACEVIKESLQIRKKILFVTYRYTYPVLGGGEAHLLEILKILANSGLYNIDVVAPEVTSINDVARFTSEFSYDPSRSIPIGIRNVRCSRFPLDETIFPIDLLKNIWLAQVGFERNLFRSLKLSKIKTNRIAWGWGGLEGEGDNKYRWTYVESSIWVFEASSLKLEGYCPVEKTLLIRDVGGKIIFHEKILHNFTIFINVDSGEVIFEWGYIDLDIKDPRPLGALIRKIYFDNHPLDLSIEPVVNSANDLIDPNHSNLFDLMGQAAQNSRSKLSLTDCRGPHSIELDKFVRSNIKNYDIVLTHNTVFKTTALAVKESNYHGVPVVVLPHVHLDDDYYHFNDVHSSSLASDLILVSPLKAKSYYEKFTNKNIKYLPPGCHLNNRVNDSDIIDFFNLYRLENPFFLVLGRKAPSKGYRSIIAASKLLAIEKAFKVVLIGPDDDGYVIDDPHVIYLGRQPDSVVRGALASSIALVNMSQSESFGMVIIESWMMCRPVIVNGRCEAFYDLVSDSINGFLVNSESKLEDAMSRLLDNRELASKMGLEGNKIAQEYTWDSIGVKLLSYLDDLLMDGKGVFNE